MQYCSFFFTPPFFFIFFNLFFLIYFFSSIDAMVFLNFPILRQKNKIRKKYIYINSIYLIVVLIKRFQYFVSVNLLGVVSFGEKNYSGFG